MAMHRFRLSLIAPALAMFFGGCARGAIIDERAILGIEETGGQIRAGGRIVECVPLGNNEVQYRIMGELIARTSSRNHNYALGLNMMSIF